MILPNVTVTPAAAKFIRRMVRFSEHPAGGFRLSVSPGGCSGYSSEFTVMVGDVRVFLPAESRLVLDGVTVDFAESPTQSGLTFFNPAAAPCGCSSSGGETAKPAEATVSLSSLKRH